MKGLLLTVALMMQTPAPKTQPAPGPLRLKETIKDFPRSQFQPAVTVPISIDLNQTARVTYATLADLAGLNIIFDSDFRDVFAPFRIEKLDIVDALDRLSLQTGNFVEVLDSKTILVAPNNATKRRDYERLVLKTIYLTNARTQQELMQIITTLRTTAEMRYLALSTSRNAIIVRDTPDRVASAERIIADLDRPAGNQTPAPAAAVPLDTGNETGGILRSRAYRSLSPAESKLELKTTGAVTINMNDDSRTSFETLAGMAGVNMIFDRDWRSAGVVPLKLQSVSVLDALDFLALETRSFWEALDSRTILVFPDSQSKRREYERTAVKTFRLADSATQRDITEIITALRTLFNLRYLAQVPATNTIVVHAPPSLLALAEKVIADLDRPAANSAAVPVAGIPFDSGSETSGVLRSHAFRKAAPAESQLQPKATGPLTVDLKEDTVQSYGRLAGMAGLRVVFDGRLQNGSVQTFKLKDVDVMDALDFLSLKTGTFWKALDATTIMVASDNPTNRRDLDQRSPRTIQLTKIQTPAGIQEVVVALRTLLNVVQIDAAPNTIVLRDTTENIALAEKLVAALDK